MQDFRYTLRTLLRKPGFSVAAVVVLALGIGANTAIFTVVRAVLLSPLPYPHADRLVNLYERDVVGTQPYNTVSAPNVDDWRQAAHSFETVALYGGWGSSLSLSDGGLPEVILGAICDENVFATLGVQPALGRAFRAADERQGAEHVMIISDSLWRRRFGGNPSAIGAHARVDGELYTVIGVMPAGFAFPSADAQEWLPLWQNVPARTRLMRGNHRFSAVARLKDGVSAEQARTELDGIARRIKEEHPGDLTGKGANVALMQERMVARVRPMLLVLLGAVVCVLLIACVNVTNLLLVRAAERRREVAIRAALGAGKFALTRQFLVESLILSACGAALGLLLAMSLTDVLIKMAGAIPRIESVRVDQTVLAFTAGVALLTGIAIGLAPAFASWNVGLAQMMQQGGRSSTAGRSRRLVRDAMVAVEVALSLMLLIGAGLMLKSFARLRAVDPGFAMDRVLTIRFGLPEIRYKKPAEIQGFYENVLNRVRAMPGVQSAGLVTFPPLTGHQWDETFTISGRAPLPQGQFLDAVYREADPGYFQAMGIPVKRGRVFTAQERLENADKGVISEGMAAQFFPNEDPVGKRFEVEGRSYEIVGIVGDVRTNLSRAPEATMYVPIFQGTHGYAALMVRAKGDPNLLSLPIQKAMRGMDSDLPAVTVRTMEEIASGAASQNRFGLALIGLFAGLAVFLASIGLYGVLSYSTAQRTKELGVRIALGASSPDITQLVVWQGLRPAAIGILIGLAGGTAATKLIQSMLFEVKPADPQILGGMALLLTAISLVACFIPAWRATKVDPVHALRAE